MPDNEMHAPQPQHPYPGESALNTKSAKEERISVSRMRELSLIAGELVERAETIGVKRHEFCLFGRLCQQYAER